MNLITNKHCKERRLVGKSGGGEIISFIVLPPLRHTRRTGRPSRIEITQFFWKLFPVDFGFLKFLGNGDVFFLKRLQSEDTSRTCIWTSGRISQIPRIGRFRGQMQLVCILFETMSMFSFPDMQRGQPGEKENLVFCITWAWLKKTGQLRISMISSFSSSSGCWPVHLFQHFPSLLWLWAISFHQINFNIFVHIFFKLSSISLHLTEMKIEVSLLPRGR